MSTRGLLLLAAFGALLAALVLLTGCSNTGNSGGINTQQIDAPQPGKCVVVNQQSTGSIGVWCK